MINQLFTVMLSVLIFTGVEYKRYPVYLMESRILDIHIQDNECYALIEFSPAHPEGKSLYAWFVVDCSAQKGDALVMEAEERVRALEEAFEICNEFDDFGEW